MQFLGLMAGLFGLDILLKGKIEAGDKEDFQGYGRNLR